MKKALLALLCVIAIVVTTIFGTLAYFTSTTNTVTNTFTVGNVEITLDEANVDELGDKIDETRVTANEYKLIPGEVYMKDPTVHIDDESEDCWIFVKVEDGLAAIQDAETVAEQMTRFGWSLLDGETNIYAYKETVSAGDDVLVFESFKIKGDVTNDTNWKGYEDAKIEITAYAIQAHGLNTAAEAWTSASSQLGK